MSADPRQATRRPVILLIAGVLAAIILNAGYTTWAVGTARSEQRAEQAAARREGQIIEHKICATLAALAARKPPAGDPASNPSRAYLQGQHATLDQLGPDLGCG